MSTTRMGPVPNWDAQAEPVPYWNARSQIGQVRYHIWACTHHMRKVTCALLVDSFKTLDCKPNRERAGGNEFDVVCVFVFEHAETV